MAIERYYSANEVMKMLQISKTTLYRIQKKGDLIPAMVGSQRRFPESQILAYLRGENEGLKKNGG